MGWSEAARLAAAAARKAHGYAKSKLTPSSASRARAAPHIRKELARQVKLLRSGNRFASKTYKSDLMARVVASSAKKRSIR